MLILTRNVGETIRIGDDIEISVAEVRGGAVRLSIKAPREVKVFREEVYQRINLANTLAAQVTADVAAALAASAPTGTPETGTPEAASAATEADTEAATEADTEAATEADTDPS